MRTLARLVLCAALALAALGCQSSSTMVASAPDVTGASEAELHRYVGERVSLHGPFSLLGKAGPYVRAGERPIYLLSSGPFSWGERYTRMEGQDVRVTGILRFAHYPNPPSGGIPIDRPEDCFYFDAASASVELNQNAAGGPLDGLPPQETALYQHVKSETTNYREGEPLEDFLTRLHIGNAPFDRLYTNQPGHESRVYHLGKFFLRLDIECRDGELYTADFVPGLCVDGLTREQRLQKFNESLADYFREKQEGLESSRQTAPADPNRRGGAKLLGNS